MMTDSWRVTAFLSLGWFEFLGPAATKGSAKLNAKGANLFLAENHALFDPLQGSESRENGQEFTKPRHISFFSFFESTLGMGPLLLKVA